MNESVGIDIVEFDSIKGRMNDKFINRILASEELVVFKGFNSEKRRIEYLAGRFAAKEAFVKAHKQFERSINFTDVKVLNDDNGAPYIVSPFNGDEISVSLSHSENYAVAIVLLKKTR